MEDEVRRVAAELPPPSFGLAGTAAGKHDDQGRTYYLNSMVGTICVCADIGYLPANSRQTQSEHSSMVGTKVVVEKSGCCQFIYI